MEKNKAAEEHMDEPDYYFLEDGRLVFTAAYLRRRGACCGSGCLNCPWDYINVPETLRSKLLKKREQSKPGLTGFD